MIKSLRILRYFDMILYFVLAKINAALCSMLRVAL